MPLTAQSNVENNPPQTPKFPPSTGALALIAVRAPILRSPYGLLRNPFTPCHTDPPIAYKKKLLACFRYCGSKCGKVNCYKQSGSMYKTLETISWLESAVALLTPIQNAPPKSFNATHGHGSLVWSILESASVFLLFTVLSSSNCEYDSKSTDNMFRGWRRIARPRIWNGGSEVLLKIVTLVNSNCHIHKCKTLKEIFSVRTRSWASILRLQNLWA